MKQLLIDTSIYSYALRGKRDVVDTLQKFDIIGISSISIGELLSGFKGGGREPQNREELNDFLDTPRVRLFPLDEITAEFYAEILNWLRDQGKPIPTNDIWIAAVAQQHGLALYSKDQHFKHVPGLIMI